MTERCQKKFTEKFENQNYIIYGGIVVASLAVLYFYRFHFATIVFSYVLGCVACYYGLISNILDSFVNKVLCHAVSGGGGGGGAEAAEERGDSQGCATCGSDDCLRHDSGASAEPWEGLYVHKQLDQAIEDLYNAILEQWVGSWHGRLAARPLFLDELRAQLRRASALLLRRALKVNYPQFLLERLIPCALRHLAQCAALAAGGKLALHPAAACRAAELKYLRSVTAAIMPRLLDHGELDNAVFLVLVREILSGWVLLPLADVLADPYILNALLLLATGDEPLAPLPATPDYQVEFLSTFVRGSESQCAERARLLRVDLELLVGDQRHLYAFMQHLKATGRLPLLHFYKDIKLFQTKLLNPSLSGEEQEALCREGAEMLARYGALSPELRDALEAETDVKRLQTSPALYAAARAAHGTLERVLLPRFLHSDEFYKILIGSRVPTGYQKQNKRPAREPAVAPRSSGPRLLELGAEAALLETEPAAHDHDHDDEDDALLAYLDRLADDPDIDLSTYKVVLTEVETRLQAPPRRGTVRVFRLTVQRAGPGPGAAPDALPALWEVERSEHDFHLLRGKLLEFHGDRLLADLPLPSRRDNSPAETLRYKYEDFLQRLLQRPLLRGSALLRLFLSAAPDFALLASAAAALGAAPDLQHIYRAVTLRLRKEKGQHLEAFLRNFLLSADVPRYHAKKPGVEEALEVGEAAEGEGEGEGGAPPRRQLLSPVFGDNFAQEPAVQLRDARHQREVRGFTQCLMYFLVVVVRVRGWVVCVCGGAAAAARRALDAGAERLLRRALARAACPRRLAHLVRLGHDLLFGCRALAPRCPPAQQLGALRARLGRALPGRLQGALDALLPPLQHPALNKQLVYNLLDLCIMELFPELCADESTGPPNS